MTFTASGLRLATARSPACRGTSATARRHRAPPITHTYAASRDLHVINTVVDNGGSTANNSAAGCTSRRPTRPRATAGRMAPSSINGGATYTNSTTVTLTLAKSGGGPNPATMKFSNDNSTWLGPFAFATSYTWTIPSGDGTKTVYARFFNSSGQYGDDRERHDHAGHGRARAPRRRSTRSARRSPARTRTVNLGWTAPVGVTDLGGYRMYKRLITSTGAWTLVCDTSATTCSDTHKKTDTYEYYVVAYDLATNVSPTLRRRTRPADGEAGFTLVELVVTMAVMSIVATAMMAVAMRSFTTTEHDHEPPRRPRRRARGDRPDDEAAAPRRVRRPGRERRIHADVRQLHRRRPADDRVAGDGVELSRTRSSSRATAGRTSPRWSRRSCARRDTDTGCSADPSPTRTRRAGVDQVTIDLTF